MPRGALLFRHARFAGGQANLGRAARAGEGPRSPPSGPRARGRVRVGSENYELVEHQPGAYKDTAAHATVVNELLYSCPYPRQETALQASAHHKPS